MQGLTQLDMKDKKEVLSHLTLWKLKEVDLVEVFNILTNVKPYVKRVINRLVECGLTQDEAIVALQGTISH